MMFSQLLLLNSDQKHCKNLSSEPADLAQTLVENASTQAAHYQSSKSLFLEKYA